MEVWKKQGMAEESLKSNINNSHAKIIFNFSIDLVYKFTFILVFWKAYYRIYNDPIIGSLGADSNGITSDENEIDKVYGKPT